MIKTKYKSQCLAFTQRACKLTQTALPECELRLAWAPLSPGYRARPTPSAGAESNVTAMPGWRRLSDWRPRWGDLCCWTADWSSPCWRWRESWSPVAASHTSNTSAHSHVTTEAKPKHICLLKYDSLLLFQHMMEVFLTFPWMTGDSHSWVLKQADYRESAGRTTVLV